MELVNYNDENILKKKITIEMTIGDFLNCYISRMTCNPDEFHRYEKEIFHFGEDINLFVDESVAETYNMEEIIDKLNIQHEKWLI